MARRISAKEKVEEVKSKLQVNRKKTKKLADPNDNDDLSNRAHLANKFNLNDKQFLLVYYFVWIGYSKVDSYRMAGYSAKDEVNAAWSAFESDNVKAAINYEIEQQQKLAKPTKSYLLNQLLNVINYSTIQGDMSNKLKALKQLAEMYDLEDQAVNNRQIIMVQNNEDDLKKLANDLNINIEDIDFTEED